MIKYITNEHFKKLLDGLKAEYDVFVPRKKGSQRFYGKYESYTDDITIGEVRAFEPLKAFFNAAREKVADGFKPDVPGASRKPYAIVGVKACDLKGFKIQDHVFADHDLPDPFYTKMRNDNLIISADCTCAINTCFCVALGIKPYPENDFDINLTQLDKGFLAETGSARGEDVMSRFSSLFSETGGGMSGDRDRIRAAVTGEVNKNIVRENVPTENTFKGIIQANYDSAVWKEEAENCVECGACNTICPTCHCFLLYDQKDEKRMARFRIWDSCMIKDFATVAGGHNPRPQLWMRLRNRFEKKFDFFPKVAHVYACTGCGRCISACPAKIDIRRVLKRLVQDASR